MADFMNLGKEVAKEEVYIAGEEVDVDDDLLVVFTSVRFFKIFTNRIGHFVVIICIGMIIIIITKIESIQLLL